MRHHFAALTTAAILLTAAAYLVHDSTRVAPPTARPAHPGGYAFLDTSATGPVRWRPCRSIRYQLNDDRALPGADKDLHLALQRITAASGISFADAGPSHQVPGPDWTDDPQHPVLIAWADPEDSTLLTPGAAGNGGAASLGGWYVTGSVVLNSADNNLYRPGTGPGTTRVNLLTHELGHVVGLADVDTPGQLMYTTLDADAPDGLAAGDRTGLTHLGAGCAPH